MRSVIKNLAWKVLIPVLMPLLILTGCGDRTGGGGISVGSTVDKPVDLPLPTTSEVYLTLAAKTLSQAAAPGFAPLAASFAYPVSAVQRVEVGIRKIKLFVAGDCLNGRQTKFEREGLYVLSLTDGVIVPEPAPLEISRNTELCRLKIEWSGGEWEEDKKSETPPSLYIEGTLNDGRPLQLATKRVKEFEIVPPTGIPVTSDVVELELNFPYRNWLTNLDPLELKSSSDGVVRVNDDDNDEFLDGVELKFDEEGDLEKKEECDFDQADEKNRRSTGSICKKNKEKNNED